MENEEKLMPDDDFDTDKKPKSDGGNISADEVAENLGILDDFVTKDLPSLKQAEDIVTESVKGILNRLPYNKKD